MKEIIAFGDSIVEALRPNYQIDEMAKDEMAKAELPYWFRITFKTRGGKVQQLVRLYPSKVQFEDLYHYDNNALAGGHNTLPIEFIPIYNVILSNYVKETGSIPEVDFILF